MSMQTMHVFCCHFSSKSPFRMKFCQKNSEDEAYWLVQLFRSVRILFNKQKLFDTAVHGFINDSSCLSSSGL